MHHLVQIWFQWVEQWGYVGIILLMAMESSIFPVPSEIVIPPAAFLAMEGKLNTFGVIAAGTFGSWLGATATDWAALWLGRVFIAVLYLLVVSLPDTQRRDRSGASAGTRHGDCRLGQPSLFRIDDWQPLRAERLAS